MLPPYNMDPAPSSPSPFGGALGLMALVLLAMTGRPVIRGQHTGESLQRTSIENAATTGIFTVPLRCDSAGLHQRTVCGMTLTVPAGPSLRLPSSPSS